MTTHDFKVSLTKSHEWADAPWWKEIYEQAFPGCLMQDMRADGPWQRMGIDRRLHLPNCTTVTVDEKVRSEDWNDFLIEAYSVWKPETRRQVGWIETASCDYLAYAFIPSRRCWLLPMRELQRVWAENRRSWWRLAAHRDDGFRFTEAKNRGYITLSLAVPIPIVLDAVRDSLLFTWISAAA